VLEARKVGVGAGPLDRFILELPVNAICAEAAVQVHLALLVVAAKHASEPIAEGRHGAVENAVGRGDQVARDNRVGGVAPDHVGAAGGAIFPRDVGQRSVGHGKNLLENGRLAMEEVR
jgi:hypothetical protein